jgi:outer membrane protein OmpA-like peptidoglycan-associated protein
MRVGYGLAAAAAVAAGLSANSAFAGGVADSAYLSAGGGAVFLQDEDFGLTTIKPDTGWLAEGALGVRWPSGWRAELEGAYRDNDVKLGIASGDVHGTSLMLNVLRDFDLGWKIKPYVGAGVGALFTEYKVAGVSSATDTNGVAQAIVGLTIPISNALEGYADYRFVDTFSTVDAIDDHYMAHEVTAGIRWTFWKAEAPVAAAPPPPPPATKDYVIYFEFNKSNITPAAGAVLDELKSTVGGKPVSVVGHTDTVGSLKYNQGLSEKRAHSTGKALVTRGVKVESESGKSWTEPAVNTGPGVKEPLNRRAVIKVDQGAGM